LLPSSKWVSPLLLLIFLQMPHLIAGRFTIIPPQNPVIAVIGEDVVLPCQLTAADNPDTITVQWILSRPPNKIEVSTYDGQIKEVRRDERYQGRTQFFQTEFRAGNVSLNLKDIKVSDKGKYTCSVSLNTWYDEVVVELDVTARGAKPSIFLEDYAGQGIGLTCKAEGWFPEPQVLWLDSKGENRTEKLTTNKKETLAKIYNIESSIIIEPGSDNEASCKIINHVLKTASESRVLISEPNVFFPTTSPWMAAFLVILFLSIATIAAVGFVISLMYEERPTSPTNVFSSSERLSTELDFRRAQSYAVAITLDPDCKHPELRLSEDKKRVWREAASPQPAAASRALLVVGRKGFVDGRQYWEVEVGCKGDWELGVLSQAARETVKREEAATLPGEGCWSLRRSQGDLFSSPEMIGVFLDREEGRISFYDAGMMFPIVTIPAGLTEKCLYYPFLSPGNSTGEQKPLTILPV
uniref:Butyrophilin subfamily 1 member A1 n=1 Tax=Pelodiscus sinensis TaxID=13735 RepID=K7FQW7_PELSI